MLGTRCAADWAAFALVCMGMQPLAANPVLPVGPNDCVAERRAMAALGHEAEAREQIAEANSVSPGSYGDYIAAFRAGLKASTRDGDATGVASYRLSICAFEVAALRGRLAASGQQAIAPPQGTTPVSARAAPVLINGNQAGGFVAPPKPKS